MQLGVYFRIFQHNHFFILISIIDKRLWLHTYEAKYEFWIVLESSLIASNASIEYGTTGQLKRNRNINQSSTSDSSSGPATVIAEVGQRSNGCSITDAIHTCRTQAAQLPTVLITGWEREDAFRTNPKKSATITLVLLSNHMQIRAEQADCKSKAKTWVQSRL